MSSVSSAPFCDTDSGDPWSILMQHYAEDDRSRTPREGVNRGDACGDSRRSGTRVVALPRELSSSDRDRRVSEYVQGHLPSETASRGSHTPESRRSFGGSREMPRGMPYRYTSRERVRSLEHTERRSESEDRDSIRFIFNEYTRRRGAPKLLEIHCRACSSFLMSYQKDGPGALLRCYLDRIHRPENLKQRSYERFDVKTSPELLCGTCGKVIGIPMIYLRENRPAYRMIQRNFNFFERF